MSGKIIVVDDSELVLEMCRMLLEDAGFTVVVLDSPLRLPVIAGQEQPDVVLLDVKMPALKGDRALKISKEFGFLDQAAVVFHSDMDEKELAALAESAGASGYIKKTEDADAFLSAVQSWVDRARAARAAGG